MSYLLITYKDTIKFWKRILLVLVYTSFCISLIGQHRSYYDKYEYRKKRHEINLGIGASGCLTDLGGADFDASVYKEDRSKRIFRSFYDLDLAKTKYVINAAYLYHWKRKINFRANLSISSVSADDQETEEFFRNNRNLHFRSPIIEFSGIAEFYLAKPSTGTKYNLKNTGNRKIAPRYLSHLGVYFFGGVGGFYFDPVAFHRFSYDPIVVQNTNFSPTSYTKKIKLRELHTEGQGMEDDPAGFARGKTYKPISVCLPLGFGIEKAISNDIGLKLEGGFRYTFTDYLDDVSQNYYDRTALEAEYGLIAASMSGTWTGNTWTYYGMAETDNNGNWIYPQNTTPEPLIGGGNVYSYQTTHTAPGYQRGNPENNDSYFFVVMSMYKKLDSQTKAYRTINMHQKRKIKASF